ncbi:MAG TPA: sulfotransferase [Rhizomicrobium sp.]|jgi:Flp pilus assembly protein TadD|nr:sulfotransferase [Rhizomicrobium sp.]
MTTATTDDRVRLLREIQSALTAQDVARATVLAREALDKGIEEPFVLNLRAYWHESEGRNTEAVTDLERAYSLTPTDIPVINALGLAYARTGRMREAVRAFDGILEIDPNFAPAHFNKGWTSEDLGDLDTARAAYTRAAELMPQSADPAGHLAALAARLGDWPAARAAAARALQIQPRHALAVMALAGAEIAAKNFAAAEERLTLLLAGTSLSPAERARAEGIIADLFDAHGHFGEAFAAYTRRNRLLREQHRLRYASPGIETMPQYLAWLTDAFAATAPERWADIAPPSGIAEGPRRHVFVLGFARSGTTLLEEILARDPDVVTTQERDALSDSVREFLITREGFAKLASAGRGALRNGRSRYWLRIQEMGIDPTGKVLVDKQPFNTYKLPLIAKLFPEGRIVFSVRDPRDVVLSCFRRQFRMNASTFEFLDLMSTARLYDATMRAAELFRSRLPLAVLELRHEDLIADFDGRMREVCDFTGVAWSEGLRDFAAAQGRRAVATPSSAQIRRGLNDSGVGAWRDYRAQLEPVLPLLAPWIERFNYPNA